MIISDMINILVQKLAEHGDIEVYHESADYETRVKSVSFCEEYTDAYDDKYPNRLLLW